MDIKDLTISQRLRLFFDTLNMEQQDFAAKINVSRQVVSNALRGRTRYVKSDFLIKVINVYPQLNLYWLLLGIGEMIGEPVLLNDDLGKANSKLIKENSNLKSEIITLLKQKQATKEPVFAQ